MNWNPGLGHSRIISLGRVQFLQEPRIVNIQAILLPILAIPYYLYYFPCPFYISLSLLHFLVPSTVSLLLHGHIIFPCLAQFLHELRIINIQGIFQRSILAIPIHLCAVLFFPSTFNTIVSDSLISYYRESMLIHCYIISLSFPGTEDRYQTSYFLSLFRQYYKFVLLSPSFLQTLQLIP